MDEAIDLADYLPVSFKTPSEQEYIAFLWKAFEQNHSSGIYQFAFLAYHMLMMTFAYFKIWQLRDLRPDDFEKGLIGFARDDDRKWLRDNSPFTFSRVNERSILRLFRLIGCDEGNIRSYKNLVDDRNDAAHANGNVYFKAQLTMDARIRQVLQAVEEIQTHSQPLINGCYKGFLLQSYDPLEREYPNTEDQILEVLIRGNYMSQKDIDFCVSFDIATLQHHERDAIEALHRTLCEVY